MDTLTWVFPMGGMAGHGLAAFHPGGHVPESFSIGDQQAEMALRACSGVAASTSVEPVVERNGPTCLHCGAEMHVLEDEQIGEALHLSAECPRCGCLRASYIELSPKAPRFLEIPQEASFD